MDRQQVEEQSSMKTKYEHIKKLVLDLRRANPEFTGNDILDALREMGAKPVPTRQSVSGWCLKAGMPLPRQCEKGDYSLDLRNRAVAMREAGMRAREIMERFALEMDNPPSMKWIYQAYHLHGNKGAKVDARDPFSVVSKLKSENAIELSECWDELVNRGADEDEALAWVMDKFYGGAAYVSDAETGNQRRGNSGGTARVYSIREGRRVAA